MPFPKLTIAVKLYAIFALVATLALVIAVGAQQLRAAAPDADTGQISWLVGGMAIVLVVLAAAGAAVVWRSCAGLAAVAAVTEQIAHGRIDVVVPHRDRHDEIGSLAASIGAFQAAMRRNAELNTIVSSDTDARKKRADQIAADIESFSADVDATLREFMKMSSRAKKAAT